MFTAHAPTLVLWQEVPATVEKMTDNDTNKLIEAWHLFFANIQDKDKREPYHWAALHVRRLLHDSWIIPQDNEGVVDNPERAWEVILLLLKAARSRQGILAVNAGPLRQLMDSYYDQYIDEVRREVRDNPRLSFALSQLHVDNGQHCLQLRALGRRSVPLHFPGESDANRQQEISRIVTDWFLFVRAHRPGQELGDYYWAVEEVEHELPEIDPRKCWEVILQLLEKASSKAELDRIGFNIGILLTFNSDFIDTVKQEVVHNNRLAYALGNAYLDAEQKNEWAEFKALVDQYRTDDPFVT